MSPIRACALSVLLVPALALNAAEKMVPTKSNPPPVGTSGSYLVDKTIPAYGVLNQVPHYTDSRANSLYLEIHQVLADVESQVMGGTSAPAADSKKKKDAAPAPVGDARISELHARLVELDARIAYRTYLEQWHIDTSFSDLGRATDLLAINGQVGSATVEKVQATKPKAAPAAAPAPAPAAPKVEAPAPAPEAPAAPAAEAPAPAAPPVAEPPAAEPPAAEPPAAEPPAADPPADK
jgi:hypothetical protein